MFTWLLLSGFSISLLSTLPIRAQNVPEYDEELNVYLIDRKDYCIPANLKYSLIVAYIPNWLGSYYKLEITGVWEEALSGTTSP